MTFIWTNRFKSLKLLKCFFTKSENNQTFPEVAIFPHAYNNLDQYIFIFNLELFLQGFMFFDFYFA